MNGLKGIAVLGVSLVAGVAHGQTTTLYHGEIRNFTDEAIYLTNQSWDPGGGIPRIIKFRREREADLMCRSPRRPVTSISLCPQREEEVVTLS
jgi:hypothetical protein